MPTSRGARAPRLHDAFADPLSGEPCASSPPCLAVYDKAGNKVWVQLVQHVTGYQHYTVPPLFGFSLPMSALMYLEDGPQGTKLIKKQASSVPVPLCWLLLTCCCHIQSSTSRLLRRLFSRARSCWGQAALTGGLRSPFEPKVQNHLQLAPGQLGHPSLCSYILPNSQLHFRLISTALRASCTARHSSAPSCNTACAQPSAPASSAARS